VECRALLLAAGVQRLDLVKRSYLHGHVLGKREKRPGGSVWEIVSRDIQAVATRREDRRRRRALRPLSISAKGRELRQARPRSLASSAQRLEIVKKEIRHYGGVKGRNRTV